MKTDPTKAAAEPIKWSCTGCGQLLYSVNEAVFEEDGGLHHCAAAEQQGEAAELSYREWLLKSQSENFKGASLHDSLPDVYGDYRAARARAATLPPPQSALLKAIDEVTIAADRFERGVPFTTSRALASMLIAKCSELALVREAALPAQPQPYKCGCTFKHLPHDGCDGKPNAPTVATAQPQQPSREFILGAREGWMRACVFYVDIDAEEEGSDYVKNRDSRWPLAEATQTPVKEKI